MFNSKLEKDSFLDKEAVRRLCDMLIKKESKSHMDFLENENTKNLEVGRYAEALYFGRQEVLIEVISFLDELIYDANEKAKWTDVNIAVPDLEGYEFPYVICKRENEVLPVGHTYNDSDKMFYSWGSAIPTRGITHWRNFPN